MNPNNITQTLFDIPVIVHKKPKETQTTTGRENSQTNLFHALKEPKTR